MAWSTAVELLMAADREAPLDLDGLERLAISAHLVGRDDIAQQIGMRGFAVGAETGDFERAARAGFWTGLGLRSAARWPRPGVVWSCRQVIERAGRESVESGYLLLPVALGQEEGHDPRRRSRRTSRSPRSRSGSETPTWPCSGGWDWARR